MNDFANKAAQQRGYDTASRTLGAGNGAIEPGGTYHLGVAITQLADNNSSLSRLLGRLEQVRAALQGPVPTDTLRDAVSKAPGNVLDTFADLLSAQRRGLDGAHDIMMSVEMLLGVSHG